MKTITWASEDNALRAITANKDLYIISFSDTYSSHAATEATRKATQSDRLHCIQCNLDDMAKKVDIPALAKFLLSIPENGELIVHCTEGRFRSKYLVEAIRNAWGRTQDEFIASGECLGIPGTDFNRNDVWNCIRPIMFALSEELEKAKPEGDSNAVE